MKLVMIIMIIASYMKLNNFEQVERGELKTSQLMKQLGLNEDTYYHYVREYRKGEIG